MRTPGRLVKTASGEGRTYNSEEFMNGKIIVHLLAENGQPLLDGQGKPRKILVSRDKIQYIGYID
jgi:hypothetical protein